MTVTGSIASTTANREERLTPPLAGSRRRTALAHAAAAAGALVLAAIVVDRTDGKTPDDAFILFRYAQHLLDGQGWVYNLRHPTSNAVSAPPYTLAIVLVASAVGDVELASTLLFVGTTALSGYLAFAVLRSSGMTLGGAVVHTCLLTGLVQRRNRCVEEGSADRRGPRALRLHTRSRGAGRLRADRRFSTGR